MNTKTSVKRGVIVLAIVLVLYCVIVFAIPFFHGRVFWLSFIFTIFTLLAQFYVLKSSFAHATGVKSKFYGFPIARIGLIWLNVQIVTGIVCMALGLFIPLWVALVVFVLILALAAIGLITTEAIRDEVERQDGVIKCSVTIMRSLQSKADATAAMCEDDAIKPTLTKIAELFRFSDPVSSDDTSEMESHLVGLMDELHSAALNHDQKEVDALSVKIKGILVERNTLCKTTK